MNRIFVFDIDDTLVIHTKGNNDLYNMNSDNELQKLIKDTPHKALYVYTNGTYGHGYSVLNNLTLTRDFSHIFARDNISYMKPLYESFLYVDKEINRNKTNQDVIIFFDDIIDNLLMARKFGWITVWVSPDFQKKPKTIDYAFANIYDALINF